MNDVDQETVSGLADKLDALNLTDAEQRLLDRLLDRATSYVPEVSGFSRFNYSGDSSGADLSPMGFKLGRGLGLLPTGLKLGDIDPSFTSQRPPPP